MVTLTATVADGYTFVNWTGDASGATVSVQVTMDADKTVTDLRGDSDVPADASGRSGRGRHGDEDSRPALMWQGRK